MQLQSSTEERIKELEQQVEEYRLLLDSTPVMFWYKDTNNNAVLVNQSAAALEGTTVEAISGKSAWDLYPKEQADAFYQDDLEVINSGKPKLGIIEKHTSVQTGELMWLQTGKVPYRDKDGKIVGVVAFAVDITEQKRAEEKLQAAHAELQAKQRQIARAHELFHSTIEQLTDAVKRGATHSELREYLEMIQQQFAKIENSAS